MAKSSHHAKSSHRDDTSAEEIGFLAGGPGRAAEAAVARLMDGGLVRISREGHVTAVHQNGYGATTPIEVTIFATLNRTSYPLGSLVASVARGQEMEALRKSLIYQGMQRKPGMSRSTARGLQIMVIFAACPLVAVSYALDRNLLWIGGVALFLAFLVRPKGNLTEVDKVTWRLQSRGNA